MKKAATIQIKSLTEKNQIKNESVVSFSISSDEEPEEIVLI
jgi:hypothetical protein